MDDGSRDRTAEVARRFASKEVAVVSTENQGAAAARNHALQLSQGDYIQWLDADDLLAPDKIERQLAALREVDSRRILLSSPWASFYYRTRRARFVHNSLCQDLSPVEWLLRKMGENLHMQTATWLTSRELAEAAGPWDTRLHYDDDGEYFCRVLLASEGTRFVPGTGVFYRVTAVEPRELHWQLGQEERRDAPFDETAHSVPPIAGRKRTCPKGLLDIHAELVPQFLSGTAGYCCGVAGAGCTTSGSPGGAPLALEICLDETDVWMESCEMGSEGASAAQDFVHQALGQGNV